MPKSTLRYEQGDVVVLELSFTDLIGSKLRPVLVINKEDLGNDLIVLKITGTPGKFRIKLTQGDLIEGKLKKESYIDSSSVFTVDKSLVVKRVGKLREEKVEAVLTLIGRILGM